MEFYCTSTEIESKPSTKAVFEYLRKITLNREGYCYFKYPHAGGRSATTPEIVVIDKEYGACILEVFDYSLRDINHIDDDEWTVNGKEVDSPLWKIDDYIVKLSFKFNEYRLLRDRVEINGFVCLTSFSSQSLMENYPGIDCRRFLNCSPLSFQYNDLWPDKSNLEGASAELFIAVSQGAGPLNTVYKPSREQQVGLIGESIPMIDHRIRSLAKEQHAAAIQIPDGPQRIRGMAGTGKTIILTMKAAFLHARHPEKKILYTFHTQALYNQVQQLIERFYTEDNRTPPNYEKLLIRHSWGGKHKEGVYTRICQRNSIVPFRYSRNMNPDPLEFIYRNLLGKDLEEEFDFVLVDEAQDFPPSFFQVLYKVTKDPKRIIFAYDELQRLDDIQMADVHDLFGYNSDGVPRVDFSNGDYGNGIEMDYVLKKSYRNPLEVLMLAHGTGLGLHNPLGEMQVIENKSIWKSIGYEVIQGNCQPNDLMVIERPINNSVSVVHEFYNGPIDSIRYKAFEDRNSEIQFIAADIARLVNTDKVPPHHIVVISLSNSRMVDNFGLLQKCLFEKQIMSIIPGIDVERDEFASPGSVTLSTVFKAKGNEAFVVYVMGFDYLYDYVNFLETRNKAFTAISRSKGWLVITGCGSNMEKAIVEIDTNLKDIYDHRQFIFNYPHESKIARKLSAEEHAKRLHVKKEGEQAIESLLEIDENFIKSLPREVIQRLKDKLGE